jgi:flavorubredoxin
MMTNSRKIINDDFYYVGGNDRRISVFEGVYPCPKGISYNAYIVKDEKNVLLDTVDASIKTAFFDNIEKVLEGGVIDYVVINHMEPDHSAAICEVLRRYPNAILVCTQRILDMLGQFQRSLTIQNIRLIKEGDVLETGKYKFTFIAAPMVHWPEVIVTYEMTTGTLFSADAFGTFNALSGNLYADEYNFETEWLPEARRYYTNIVGKYGTQVNVLLNKTASLNINYVCPLHGPIWRKNFRWFIEKYTKWASYVPEEPSFLLVYGSIYGGTKTAIEHFAGILADKGIRNIAIYDVSITNISELIAECFRVSHIVFASPTYNANIFTPMENLLLDLKYHNFQNRTVGIIENGSWAATSGRLMTEILSSMKNIKICEPLISLHSTPAKEQHNDLEKLADAMLENFIVPN